MSEPNRNLDYPKLTKQSFLFGVALFVAGVFGESLIHSLGLEVPGWEQNLLFGIEAVGVLVALLSPFVFGILLALTE